MMNVNQLSTEGIVMAHSERSDGSMMSKKIIQRENVHSFLSQNKIPFGKTFFMNQIHGNDIRYVDQKSPGVFDGADGLITKSRELYLGVVTADCLPVLLWDKENSIAGAVHAGYKGLLSGVLDSWINEATKIGAKTKNLKVYIGPSIQACCYNVDSNRVEEFVDRFKNENRIIRYHGDHTYLNLSEVAKVNLENFGVDQENIFVSDQCTSCNDDKYFSYRKDSQSSFGHMLSVIGIKN